MLVLVYCTWNASAGFGEEVILHDLDGDLELDLIASDPLNGAGGDDAGAVFIFYDAEQGNLTTSEADTVITGQANSKFGTGLALADVNGDGDADLVIGAPNASSGAGSVYVFLHPYANGTYADADGAISAPSDYLGFGASLEACSLNGDNLTDIAVGSIAEFEGGGLLGTYFDTKNLEDPEYSQVDEEIDFDWGSGSPAGIGGDTFSIRWTGLIHADETGSHEFTADSDDGIRLWIDGELVLDAWYAGVLSPTGSVYLTEGHHDIRVEYFENTGGALVSLEWDTPYDTGIIPSTNLFPMTAFPVVYIEGTGNASTLSTTTLPRWPESNTLGASLESTSSEGLFIGSPSTGDVFFIADEDAAPDVAYHYAVPATKGSGDQTGENVASLWADDNDYYNVPRGSNDDDMYLDTFNIEGISGNVVSVTLWVRYLGENGYSGDNNIQYAIEGDSYTDTTIEPDDDGGEVTASYDLYSAGVRTLPDLYDLNIHFNNDDGGIFGADDIDFEFIILQIGVAEPGDGQHISGPASFGSSIAVHKGDMYIGAPEAGPIEPDADPSTVPRGGLVFATRSGSFPETTAMISPMIGPEGSRFGEALDAGEAGDGPAIGAPDGFYGSGTGGVYMAEKDRIGSRGIAPTIPGNAGSSVSVYGQSGSYEPLIAVGNPEGDTVHIVNHDDIPEITTYWSTEAYVLDPVGRQIALEHDGSINITGYGPSGWGVKFNGVDDLSTSDDLVNVSITPDSLSNYTVPVVMIARDGSGLRAGLSNFHLRTINGEIMPADMSFQRMDDAIVEPPLRYIENESGMIVPFIDYHGPRGAEEEIVIEIDGTYLNRTLLIEDEPLVLGEDLSIGASPQTIWSAETQSGPMSEVFLGANYYSWRVVIRGEYLEQRGDRIRLRFSSAARIVYHSVYIAEAQEDDRDVVSETWTQVTFGGVNVYNSSNGEVFTSDWIDFPMSPTKNYSVSFVASALVDNAVDYWTGNNVLGSYRRGVEYRDDKQWSDDALDTYNVAVCLMAVESWEMPRSLSITSSTHYSKDGWATLDWSSTVSEGSSIRFAIRTAVDYMGSPVGWSSWHGPGVQDYYSAPGPIDGDDPWIQYRAELMTGPTGTPPILHEVSLDDLGAGWNQTNWTRSHRGDSLDFNAVYGENSFWDWSFTLPIKKTWVGAEGSYDVNVTAGSVMTGYGLDVKTRTPVGGYSLYGTIIDVDGDPAGSAYATATNVRTGDALNTTTDALGEYSFDMTLFTSGYLDGDLIAVNASYKGAYGDAERYIYSEDGSGLLDFMMEMNGFDIFVMRRTTASGPGYISMFRESDMEEIIRPVETEQTQLFVTIGNRGDMEARDVVTGFFINGSLLGSQQVFNIAPGDLLNVTEWWTPDEGAYNITFKAWNMTNENSIFSVDLWDSPLDEGGAVDFTTDAHNTIDISNTWGYSKSSPWSTFDGWDWETSAYEGEDSQHIAFRDPLKDSDGIREGVLEIQIGGQGVGELSGSCSGAWGTQFFISPEDFAVVNGSQAFLRFTYSCDNLDNDLEENAAVLGSISNSSSTLWLGSSWNPFDPVNASIWRKQGDRGEVFNRDFEQNVTAVLSHSGHYYLDFGAKVQDTSYWEEGIRARFDDISLGFYQKVGDAFSPNDERGLDVEVLPSYPTAPYNITLYLYDEYDVVGIPANFTVETSHWSFEAQTDEDGYYDISVPVGNYTEADELTIEVDDIVDDLNYVGSHEMLLYSYESPTNVSIALVQYGLRVDVLTGTQDLYPGDNGIYEFRVISDSNTPVRVDMAIEDLPKSWDVTLTGTGVFQQFKTYYVDLNAYSSVKVTATLTLPEDPAKALPDDYTWYVDCTLKHLMESAELLTTVLPVYTFEVNEPELVTTLPGEVLAYNVTITSTGNVDNIIDFNLTMPDEWNSSFSNTALPLAPGEEGYIMITISIPDWPHHTVDAGEVHNILLAGESRYSDVWGNGTLDVEIANMMAIVFNGTPVTAYPNETATYILNVTNRGNGDVEVNLTLAWNASEGNSSSSPPRLLWPGQTRKMNIYFTPVPNFNISTSSKEMIVEASDAGSSWDAVFIIGQVHAVNITGPDELNGTVGKTLPFEVVIENLGNGYDTFKVNVTNGDPDTPVISLEPHLATSLDIYALPTVDGANEVTIELLADDKVWDSWTVTVNAIPSRPDIIPGSPRKIAEDVDVFTVCPDTGMVLYLDNGSLFSMYDDEPILVRNVVGSTLDAAYIGKYFIATSDPAVTVYRFVEGDGNLTLDKSWEITPTGATAVLASGVYNDKGEEAVYLIYRNASRMRFRSFSDGWNPPNDLYDGTLRGVSIAVEGASVHIAWTSPTKVYYTRLSWYGVIEQEKTVIADADSAGEVSIVEANGVYTSWVDDGEVFRSSMDSNGTWSDPVHMGAGSEVSAVNASGEPVFLVLGAHVEVHHMNGGCWQASLPGTPHDIEISRNGDLGIHYLNDDLWVNEVQSPVEVSWSTDAELQLTVVNRLDVEMVFTPGIETDANWSAVMKKITVGAGETTTAKLVITPPTSSTSPLSTLINITAGAEVIASIPVTMVGEPIRNISLGGVFHATPGSWDWNAGSKMIITNNGNTEENVTLAPEVPEGWDIDLTVDELTIQPGEIVTITGGKIGVRSPEDLWSHPGILLTAVYSETSNATIDIVVKPMLPVIINTSGPGTILSLLEFSLFAEVIRAENVTWFMPDGGLEKGITANATLSIPGTYAIKVLAENSAGTDVEWVALTVKNRDPTAEIIVESAEVKAGEMVNLTANVYDPEGGRVTITWRIVESTVRTFNGTYVNYIFTEGGPTRVEIIVKDEHGGVASSDVIMIVEGGRSDDKGSEMDWINIGLGIGLVVLVLLLIFLVAPRRKKEDEEDVQGITDQGTFETLIRLWPQYIDVVEDMDPMAAGILKDAKVLSFDESMSVLKLGLPEGEALRKAMMPEVLETFERGIQDLYGIRVFVSIETLKGRRPPSGPRKGSKGKRVERPGSAGPPKKGRAPPRQDGKTVKRPKTKNDGPSSNKPITQGPRRKGGSHGKGGGGLKLLILLIGVVALLPIASGHTSDIADIDEDGELDVLLGSPADDSVNLASGPLERGVVDDTDTITGSADSGFGYSVSAVNGTFGVIANDGASATLYAYSQFSTFGSYDEAVDCSIPAGRNALSAGDWDGDGEVDFAVASMNSTLTVFLGPDLVDTVEIAIPSAEDITLEMADLDGDDKDEVLVVIPERSMVFIYYGDVDYDSAYVKGDVNNGKTVFLERDDGLRLEVLEEIENGDVSKGLSGWWTKDNRDDNNEGAIRLVESDGIDWMTSSLSGSPTAGFGSRQDILQRDGAENEYSGTLCSPSFTIPESVDFLHVWYRWDLVSFDRREGAYLNLYNARTDQQLSQFDYVRIPGNQDNRYRTKEDARAFDVSNYHGYEVYVGGELDGDDGRDAAAFMIDDIFYSDKDGKIARKPVGYYESPVRNPGFTVRYVIPLVEGDDRGETLEIRVRTSTDTPWEDADVVEDGVLSQVAPGNSFEFNVTMSTVSVGTSPELDDIYFNLMSESASLIKGKGGLGEGVAVLEGDDPMIALGAPDYFSTGVVEVFEAPGAGDNLEPADSYMTVTSGDMNSELGGSVAFADLDGDGIGELLAGAPGSDLMNDTGGAVFGFDISEDEVDVQEAGISLGGTEGLGRELFGSFGIALGADNNDSYVLRGWHAFELSGEDLVVFPNSTFVIPIGIDNLYDGEILTLTRFGPTDWDIDFPSGETEVLTIEEEGSATVNLTLNIPSDASNGNYDLKVQCLGDDGLTFSMMEIEIEVFRPDMYPKSIYIYRGDDRNITSNVKHMVSNDTSNITYRFYTLAKTGLPNVNLRFFQRWNDGEDWIEKDVENVTVSPVLNDYTYVTIGWTPTRSGEYYIGAEIDSKEVISELDENNNELAYRRTVIDMVPDGNYTLWGYVRDTDDSVVSAPVRIESEGGIGLDLASDANGYFSTTIDQLDYFDSEMFWVNSSLIGPPGSDSEIIKIYSEDGVGNVSLNMTFEGVDVAQESFTDPSGEVNISFWRYGDGNWTDVLVEGREALLEVALHNRGFTNVTVMVSISNDTEELVWKDVEIGPLMRMRTNLTWQPNYNGTSNLTVLMTADDDLYAPNDMGVRNNVVILPKEPATPVWINGTILDADGAPLKSTMVPLRNLDSNWTNTSITTNNAGSFSTTLNASSYDEGDRIDINVTDGLLWGNDTLFVFSTDEAYDRTIQLRRYEISVDVYKTQKIVPWETAVYEINVTSLANFADEFIITVEGVPPDFLYNFTGNGTGESSHIIGLQAGGWDLVNLNVWTLNDPRDMAPDTHQFTLKVGMLSHPRTEEEADLELEVLPFYEFSTEHWPESIVVAPSGEVEYTINVTNEANSDVSLLITAFGGPGVELDIDSTLNIPYGESRSLTLSASAPPLSPDIPAESEVSIEVQFVAVDDTKFRRWVRPGMIIGAETSLAWGPAGTREVEPGETASFTVNLTNDGNEYFYGNLTASGVSISVWPVPIALAPGEGVDIQVNASSSFQELGKALKAGTELPFTIDAEGFNTTGYLRSLPHYQLSISSDQKDFWSRYTDRIVMPITVRNLGNMNDTASITIGGENSYWALPNSSDVNISINGEVVIDVIVKTDSAGSASLVLLGTSDQAISNPLIIDVTFFEELETVVLYSSAEMVASKVDDFDSSGNATAWSNASGVYLRIEDSTMFIGEGSLPAVGMAGGITGIAWLDDGSIYYTDSEMSYVPVHVIDTIPARLDVLPGDDPTVAIDTVADLRIYSMDDLGNWSGKKLEAGEFELFEWDDGAYLASDNGSSVIIRSIPDLEIVSELDLTGLLDVASKKDIYVLGTGKDGSKLYKGRLGSWTSQDAEDWSQVIVDIKTGVVVPAGHEPGWLHIGIGDQQFTVPCRTGWTETEVGPGHLPVPPDSRIVSGTDMMYLAGGDLYRLAIDPWITLDKTGASLELPVLGDPSDLELRWNGEEFMLDSYFENDILTVNITSIGSTGGSDSPLEIYLEGIVGATNVLGFEVHTMNYLLLDVVGEPTVEAGRTTLVKLELVNTGSTSSDLDVSFDTADKWKADHYGPIPGKLRVEAYDTAKLNIIIEAPVEAEDGYIGIELTDGQDVYTWNISMEVVIPVPIAVIYTEDRWDSGVEATFNADKDFVSNWTWYFGDGGFAYGDSVSHVFERPGRYNVTLIVVGDTGADAVSKKVFIDNALPQITFTPQEGRVGDLIYFTADGFDPDGEIIGYTWNFGDGTTGNGALVAKRYSGEGTFNVTLTAVDDSGGEQVHALDVNVEKEADDLDMTDLLIKALLVAGIVIVLLLIIVKQKSRKRGIAPELREEPKEAAAGPKLILEGDVKAPPAPGRKIKRPVKRVRPPEDAAHDEEFIDHEEPPTKVVKKTVARPKGRKIARKPPVKEITVRVPEKEEPAPEEEELTLTPVEHKSALDELEKRHKEYRKDRGEEIEEPEVGDVSELAKAAGAGEPPKKVKPKKMKPRREEPPEPEPAPEPEPPAPEPKPPEQEPVPVKEPEKPSPEPEQPRPAEEAHTEHDEEHKELEEGLEQSLDNFDDLLKKMDKVMKK